MTAIVAAKDKADKKIPLDIKMDNNISMSAALRHVTGTMWSLDTFSECTQL